MQLFTGHYVCMYNDSTCSFSNFPYLNSPSDKQSSIFTLGFEISLCAPSSNYPVFAFSITCLLLSYLHSEISFLILLASLSVYFIFLWMILFYLKWSVSFLFYFISFSLSLYYKFPLQECLSFSSSMLVSFLSISPSVCHSLRLNSDLL